MCVSIIGIIHIFSKTTQLKYDENLRDVKKA